MMPPKKKATSKAAGRKAGSYLMPPIPLDMQKQIARVEVGQIWKHANGVNYTVLAIANLSSEPQRWKEYPPTVVYSSPEGAVYTKRLDLWLAKRTLLLQPLFP